ncbi:dodecin family protein [Isoptericola sp. NPDC056134]|uniref:dodecin family protein n=1 Tax=Isoptericola sp. NPDC056134 TaxID=3345723 RepID=UPI0035E92378
MPPSSPRSGPNTGRDAGRAGPAGSTIGGTAGDGRRPARDRRTTWQARSRASRRSRPGRTRASRTRSASASSRAGQTVRHITGAWVKEQKVEVSDGAIVAWQVDLQVTFVLEG